MVLLLPGNCRSGEEISRVSASSRAHGVLPPVLLMKSRQDASPPARSRLPAELGTAALDKLGVPKMGPNSWDGEAGTVLKGGEKGGLQQPKELLVKMGR